MSEQISPSIAAWGQFTQAKTSKDFLQGWLGVVCAKERGIQMAALLLKNETGDRLLPAAVWPEEGAELSHLKDLVERCMKAGHGLTEYRLYNRPDGQEANDCAQLAYPIMAHQHVMGVVVVQAFVDADLVEQLLQYLHWGIGWLIESMQRSTTQQAVDQFQRTEGVMQALAVAVQPLPLKELTLEIVNDLARRLGSSRVGLGWVESSSVHVAALSDSAYLERRSPYLQRFTSAMEEALDAGQYCVYPPLLQADEPRITSEPVLLNAHAELLEELNSKQVMSIPLQHAGVCTAILTLEWQNITNFSPSHVLWLQAYCALLVQVLADKRRAEEGVTARLVRTASGLAQKILGPGQLLWKVLLLGLAIMTVGLTWLTMDYRVTAKVTLEGQTQQVAAAPFEGFLMFAPVRAGDTVQAGQLLARLDDRELRMEQAKWRSERDQYARKLREAMAAHEMANMQILDAQFKQADAQLRLASEKIARTQIVAPYTGVVVSGDWSQMIGTPVETGKKLFEIAPLEQYRVILQVDEREIRYLSVGQLGHLVVTGISGEKIPFKVTKLTPVATTQDGKNTFRVESLLVGAGPIGLRPGMEGIGKVEVGERSLGWVITHSFMDWLRLSLWTWLP